MGLTRYKVPKFASAPQCRIDEICSGNRAVTADIAMRLARLFGISAQTWMNLQAQYDFDIAEIEIGDKIDHEDMPLAA